MSGPFDGKAVLTGAGKSQVGRRLGRTGLDLTLEAVLRAIEDAVRGLCAAFKDGRFKNTMTDEAFVNVKVVKKLGLK